MLLYWLFGTRKLRRRATGRWNAEEGEDPSVSTGKEPHADTDYTTRMTRVCLPRDSSVSTKGPECVYQGTRVCLPRDSSVSTKGPECVYRGTRVCPATTLVS